MRRQQVVAIVDAARLNTTTESSRFDVL